MGYSRINRRDHRVWRSGGSGDAPPSADGFGSETIELTGGAARSARLGMWPVQFNVVSALMRCRRDVCTCTYIHEHTYMSLGYLTHVQICAGSGWR